MRAFATLGSIAQTISSHPLTRGRQAATWLKFASWVISSRLQRELTEPWIEGQRLVVRRGMTGATGNVYFGLYEFMSMMLTLHFLRGEDLFFDIGANVGTYTVLASGIARAQTWAFEPDEEAGRDLVRNIEINGLGSLVTLHAVALGRTDGEVSFTLGDGAMNRVATAEDKATHMVLQRALDSVAMGRAPAMIKVDVEGYEEPVMLGARKTLANPALKVISLEGTPPVVLQLLADNGFGRAFYDPFTRKLTREPNQLAYADGKWTISNEFYVRDWPFVENRLATARPIEVFGRKI